jgi:hypothetical protein
MMEWPRESLFKLNSHDATSVELDDLKARVEDVEWEIRDLISIVSRPKEDCAQQDGTKICFLAVALHTDISQHGRALG